MSPLKRMAVAGTFLILALVADRSYSEVTREEVLSLLKDRDAAIIELQHTVRSLRDRLDRFEDSPPDAAESADLTESTADRRSPTPTSKDPGAAGFGRLEVDEQAAQRALERTLVQGGALLLPAWTAEFGPSLSYTLDQVDYPTTVADGGIVLLGSNDVEREVYESRLEVRVGLPFDAQLEIGVPYRWVDEQVNTRVQGLPIGLSAHRSGDGPGSVELGLAKTVVRERGWRPDVVGRVTWDTGSGDRNDNGVFLGGNFESLRGSLSVIKRADPLVYFGTVEYRTFSEDDGLEPGDQFAVSVGTALAVSPESSLFASINNQFLDESSVDNQTLSGSDISSISLRLGASTIVARGLLINLSTDVGVSEDAPDFSLQLSGSIQTNALRRLIGRP